MSGGTARESRPPAAQRVSPVHARLAALVRPHDGHHQLVHGDLAGNVLFGGGPPAVLDLSPYWRPVGYAVGITVADGLLFHRAGADLLDRAAPDTDPALVARAALFRLHVLNQGVRATRRRAVPSDLAAYEHAADILERA